MPDPILQAVRLPPKDALAYFRQKENVPTGHWTDVWQEGHAKGFAVAGAAAQGLLKDLYAGVEKAMSQGMTMEQWRKEFPQIAERYGWKYNGSPGWRADIIYDTNMTTALSAGRYRRMVTPEALELYPYWRYTHHTCAHPRPQHVAWDGIILPANDPWFQTHYPPNGWRCHCTVEVVSRAKLKRMGWEVSEAPPIETRPWINPHNGTVHQVPVGIDPGFAYNPGRAWMANEEKRSGRGVNNRFIAEDAGPARKSERTTAIAQVDRAPLPNLPTKGSENLLDKKTDVPTALPAHAPPAPEESTPHVHIPEVAQHRTLTEAEERSTAAKGILDILHSPEGKRQLPAGRVSADIRETLKSVADTALFSTDTARKQLDHHGDLTDADYTALPSVLAHPDIIAVQSDKRLLLFQRGKVLYRAALKATGNNEEIYVLSFHRTTPEKARRALKGLQIVKGDEGILSEDGALEGPAGNPS